MRVGLGKHKMRKASHVEKSLDMGNGQSVTTTAYSTYLAECPYCGYDQCEADHVDVGIGLVQCGPYYCPECHASEISRHDTRELSEREMETGWYQPGSPPSERANVIDGALVDHETARAAKKNPTDASIEHFDLVFDGP